MEYEEEDVLFRHLLRPVGGDYPLLQSLALDLLHVYSPSVVVDLYEYPVPVVVGTQLDYALSGLSCPLPFVGRLYPVVHSVSDEVYEGFFELLEDRLVHLRVLSFEDELHLLAQHPRQIPDHSRELLEEALDGLHPRLHHRQLEVPHYPVEGGDHGLELVHSLGLILIVELLEDPQEPVPLENKLPHQVHKALYLVDVYPDYLFPFALGSGFLLLFLGLFLFGLLFLWFLRLYLLFYLFRGLLRGLDGLLFFLIYRLGRGFTLSHYAIEGLYELGGPLVGG